MDDEFIERWLECPAGDLPWEELLSLTKETLSRLSATAQKALDRIPPKLGAEPGDLTTGRGRWGHSVKTIADRSDPELREMMAKVGLLPSGTEGGRALS